MTGPEQRSLDQLNARLFGLDGSGEGGAIGHIDDRLDRIERLVNRAIGAFLVVTGVAGFIGLGGVRAVAHALGQTIP